MKILLINTFYYPNIIGGTENSVKLLAENLIKDGHEVAVYSIDNLNNKTNIYMEIINEVKVYRGKAGRFSIEQRLGINKNKFCKVKNKILELWNSGIKSDINHVIKEFNPDIIHTNNIFGISPYIWKISHKKKYKVVHTLRDYWLLSPKIEIKDETNIIGKILINIYRSYFRWCSNMVDYVTAPSKFTLQVFRDYNYFKNAEFLHISNAIEIDKRLLNKLIDIKRKNNSNIINFIFVGMLSEMKGIDKLLKVFYQNNNNNIRLNICGTGKLMKNVREYADKDSRINYKGQLNKEELERELTKNDVIIVPSMWDEPFGRVVIEGNKFGLPVIGSNRGGIKEIIENIGTGILFDSDNEAELSKCINYFSERNNIKKYYYNIEKNICMYSVEHQIKSFIGIYEQLLND